MWAFVGLAFSLGAFLGVVLGAYAATRASMREQLERERRVRSLHQIGVGPW